MAAPLLANTATLALLTIAMGVVIAGLVAGKSFLIPLVVAFILSNLIEAMIERLERVHVPTLIAYMVSILVVSIAVFAIGWVVANQYDELTKAWPGYVKRVEEISTQLVGTLGDEARDKIAERFEQFRIVNRVPELLGSLGNVAVSSILVLLYVGFLLAERGLLSAKIATMMQGSAEAAQSQAVLRSVSAGVRKYVWIKTVMSAFTAAVSYLVFVWLGLDFAETWALFVFLLNYIPSIGSVLGVVFPAILALIQFDTIYPFLLIAVLLTAAQFSIGNILEPVFMGRFLNLSPFVIMVSLTFWSTIWGVPGAFLSVPIMVVVLIVCANVDALRWIAVLLSSDGSVEPTEEPIKSEP